MTVMIGREVLDCAGSSEGLLDGDAITERLGDALAVDGVCENDRGASELVALVLWEVVPDNDPLWVGDCVRETEGVGD